MSLYNDMRPERLSDVKGQDSLVKILTDNMASGHMPNAMLFIGTRGTGKTTIARIVAKRLNCLSPVEGGECCNECPSCRAIKNGTHADVLELDAASHNGVDDVRRILQDVQLCPVGKKKVYILDEVHMLSTGAFNALLKVLEEPPKDVLFILCTTELQKIPATILSRCRKYQFENISIDTIVDKLKSINSLLSLKAEEGALRMVAKAAKGSMRDAESIYESFVDAGCITEELVRKHLGYSNEDLVFNLLNAVVSGEPSAAFEAVQAVTGSGGNLVYYLEDIMKVLLDVIFVQGCGDVSAIVGTREYLDRVADMAFGVPMPRLIEIADAVNAVYGGRRTTTNMELALQGMVIQLVCEQTSLSALFDKIALLEGEIELLKTNGVAVAATVVEPVAMQTEATPEESFVSAVEAENPFGEQDEPDVKPQPKPIEDFVPLSDEEIEALKAFGFDVSSSSVAVKETAAEPVESNSSVEEDFFFDDSARPDGGFGGFAGFGGFGGF